MASKQEPTRYPNIHALLTGESGSGKSTLWATLIAYYAAHFNEPSLVFLFDPPGKATPYTDLGTATLLEDQFFKDLGVTVKDVKDKDGNLIVRIEYYKDDEASTPTAVSSFERRLMGFGKEAASWASVGVDSMTFLQHMALQRAKVDSGFKQFEAGKDGRQWYARVTEDVAALLFSRACYWDTNVGILCHVAADKEDFGELGQLKTASLQGRMAKNAPSGFDEVWKLNVTADGTRQLQTKSDSRWMCNSLVTKAPNPCKPQYEALWANWKGGK